MVLHICVCDFMIHDSLGKARHQLQVVRGDRAWSAGGSDCLVSPVKVLWVCIYGACPAIHESDIRHTVVVALATRSYQSQSMGPLSITGRPWTQRTFEGHDEDQIVCAHGWIIFTPESGEAVLISILHG